MKRRTILALVAAIAASAGVAACQGFKEAFTAHVDVVAKAGSQELTVTQLAKLLAGVQVPVTTDVAKAIANIWVDYQLLGQAAAAHDTLNKPELMDDALWAYLAQQRVGKFHDQLVKTYPGVDTAATPANFAKSPYLAAQHILFLVQPTSTPAQKDSIRRQAAKVRAEVTSANFAELAKRYSEDPGSKDKGGELGVFSKGQMVKPFQDAVMALQPGQISPLVETQYGYHIIRRNTYDEVKADYARVASGPAIAKADSVWVAGLEATANVKILPNAASTVKNVVPDVDGHATDKTVLATWAGGDFTVARLVKWLEAAPQKEQLAEQVRQMPDSSIVAFLHQVLKSEIVLRAADSAKVVLDSTEMASIRTNYSEAVVSLWNKLGVAPTLLADSGKTTAARQRVAAAIVDGFLDRLMHQQAQFVAVAPPVEKVMREQYGAKLSTAGLERAVEATRKEKASADSARAKSRPPTEVPIGGAPAKPGPR